MNIVSLKEDYDYFTSKLSDQARQLNYAGIAIIWIFRVGPDSGGIAFNKILIWSLALFALSLAADFTHYICSTIIWGQFYRSEDKKGLNPEDEIRAPKWYNYPTLGIFITKIVFTTAGFLILVSHIVIQLK